MKLLWKALAIAAMAVGPLAAKEAAVEEAAWAFAPDVPKPLERSGGKLVRITLETVEANIVIKKGIEKDTVYPAWTFNGRVPGPVFRVKEGDTIEVVLVNPKGSVMPHNVDLHSVSGPGGGAPATLAAPGASKAARFKMLNPGAYVYHCAAPPVTWHIANGMYGLIIVEPRKGLPKVDREFYVMQSDFYTKKPYGAEGKQDFDDQAAEREHPSYVVFNGAADSMLGPKALKAKVGERVRVWFGNGGPNLVSSWHIIGVIFEKLYNLGSFENPLSHVQTALVPAGGSAVADFTLKVPGNYTFVDHSIFRVQKGALGVLSVEGPANTDIYPDLNE